MAIKLFLNIDTIPGESLAKGHEGWIDILAFSWGELNSGTVVQGTGQAHQQDVGLTKWTDSTSPKLAVSCLSGQRFSNGQLDVVRDADSAPTNLMTFKLSDLLVSSLSPSASGGEDKPTENFSLNFGSIVEVFVGGNPIPPPLVTGDADGNGTFNVGDIIKMIRMYLGKDAPPAPGSDLMKALDVSPLGGDNVIDALDIKAHLKRLLGL
jgi:type VI secretion system secreted protein Hcp